jgi:peptidoglycan/xylan/chitin deacetylase (PgdA/CDA1 family)
MFVRREYMPSTKNIVKAAAGTVFKQLLSINAFRNLSIILMYHRVCSRIPEGLHDPAMFITSDTFDMHLRELRRYFEIVPLERFVEAPGKQERLCAITFDDGWADNYEHAFPVLKKHDVPATVFIPAEVIDSNGSYWFQNIWDMASQAGADGKSAGFLRYFSSHAPSWHPQGIGQEEIVDLIDKLKSLPSEKLDGIILRAYGELGIEQSSGGQVMNWNQVREMGRQGIAFGSHGLHHYILPQLPQRAKRHEVVDSLRVLQQAGIAVAPFFSYPNGDWDDETRLLVEQAGYQGGVSTRLGCNAPSTDRCLLKRIPIHEDISNTSSLLWFRIFQAVAGMNAG